MISNDAVQRLMACDRETLVALMAAAMAAGRMGGGEWNIWLDPDIRRLMDAAREANRQPATLTPATGWARRGDKL